MAAEAHDISASTPGVPSVPKRMKAAVFTAYGSPEVIRIQELATPVPTDDEVLIQVRAVALNPLDWRVMRGSAFVFRLMFGLRRPKDGPGRDVAGQVVRVGRNVTGFKPGDSVFGACLNATAEYACANPAKLAHMPGGMSFERAASIPIAGLTALQGLRDHGVHVGTKLLINGAAGGVGTFSVQIAKWLGADVTGVCSTKNVEMVRSLGADRVIDYTQEDITRRAGGYDLVLENVGNLPLAACRRMLNRGGKVIMAGAPKKPWAMITHIAGMFLLNALDVFTGEKKRFHMLLARIGTGDLACMADLVEQGKLKPVIDRTYPMIEVADAVRYLETGHAPGKVIILLGG